MCFTLAGGDRLLTLLHCTLHKLCVCVSSGDSPSLAPHAHVTHMFSVHMDLQSGHVMSVSVSFVHLLGDQNGIQRMNIAQSHHILLTYFAQGTKYLWHVGQTRQLETGGLLMPWQCM